MQRKPRIGIIGGGGILKPHAEGYRLSEDRCEVVAVAKKHLDDESTRRIHELLGKEVPVYDDFRHLLCRDDIDAVDVLTPHDLHMPITLEAARSGKHVLVEKVMARNVFECDRMIEACDKAGVSLHVCHDRRYLGDWLSIKEIIDSGELGEVFYLKLEHNQNVVLPQGHWVRSFEQIGGGALMSCLTHQVDALRWFGGEVDSIAAMTKVLPDRMEGETAAVIAARMASQALANLSINWFTTINVAGNGLWCEFIQICGTKGELYYTSDRGTWFKSHTPKEIRARTYRYDLTATNTDFVKIEPKDPRSGIPRCVCEWVRHLAGEEAYLPTTGIDSRKTVEVAEAAYRSEESGAFVKLPIQPREWKAST